MLNVMPNDPLNLVLLLIRQGQLRVVHLNLYVGYLEMSSSNSNKAQSPAPLHSHRSSTVSPEGRNTGR